MKKQVSYDFNRKTEVKDFKEKMQLEHGIMIELLDPKIYHFITSPEGVVCVNNWGYSYVYTKLVENGLREFMDTDLKKLNDICNIMKLPIPEEDLGFGYL